MRYPNAKSLARCSHGKGVRLAGKQTHLTLVGAASSRDHFNSRLEADPTSFFNKLDLPDKPIINLTVTEILPFY